MGYEPVTTGTQRPTDPPFGARGGKTAMKQRTFWTRLLAQAGALALLLPLLAACGGEAATATPAAGGASAQADQHRGARGYRAGAHRDDRRPGHHGQRRHEDCLVAYQHRSRTARQLAEPGQRTSSRITRTSRSRSPCWRTRPSRPSWRPPCNPAARPIIFQSWGGGVLKQYARRRAGAGSDPGAARRTAGATTFQPGPLVALQVGRQDLRRALGRGHGRLLVQQEPVQEGRHRRAAGDLDRSARRP